MKLIFLDIDGVLNFQSHFEDLYRGQRPTGLVTSKLLEYHSQMINFEALKRVELLCEKTKASIVISSTWRRYMDKDRMNELFRYCGLKNDLPIIGSTPYLYLNEFGNLPRGCEINQYLEKEFQFRSIYWSEEEQQKYIDKSGIENYIILDDDSDMLYNQRNHFIHILPSPRNIHSFSEEYYNKALKKLSKTIIELNY